MSLASSVAGRVFGVVWWMMLRRCKGQTYHKIEGTIENLSDLRHVASKGTEDLGRSLQLAFVASWPQTGDR